MDYRLELVLLPVADVDRAKAFYSELCGFNVDVDFSAADNFRVVQLTPPGSDCSVSIGKGITEMAPGSVRGLHLCVTEIERARSELVSRGVNVSEVRHLGPEGWTPGVDPNHSDYNSYADFADPDGNTWLLQEKGYKSASKVRTADAVVAAAGRGRRRPRKV